MSSEFLSSDVDVELLVLSKPEGCIQILVDLFALILICPQKSFSTLNQNCAENIFGIFSPLSPSATPIPSVTPAECPVPSLFGLPPVSFACLHRCIDKPRAVNWAGFGVAAILDQNQFHS